MRLRSVLVYSLVCAALLVIYWQMPGLPRYLFSIGAIFAGIRFFREHEQKQQRIVFFVAAAVLFVVLLLGYSSLAGMYGWPLKTG